MPNRDCIRIIDSRIEELIHPQKSIIFRLVYLTIGDMESIAESISIRNEILNMIGVLIFFLRDFKIRMLPPWGELHLECNNGNSVRVQMKIPLEN